MTDGGERQIGRKDIDELRGELHALERQFGDRLTRLEMTQSNGIGRLETLEKCLKKNWPPGLGRRLEDLERDRRRLWLLGWGAAFALGSTLLQIARQALF